MSLDPHGRFSHRVDDYQRHRPWYPEAAVAHLLSSALFGETEVLADVGSGTGILSAQLLAGSRKCERLFAVEPNPAMREAAVQLCGGDPRFRSVAASAEATSLADHAVGGIVAAQAFHWFDFERCRVEFGRILASDGSAAVLWNSRREDHDAFHRDYEGFLRRTCPSYLEVRATYAVREQMARFFCADYRRDLFPFTQELNSAELVGRLQSCSYAPAAGSEAAELARVALLDVFEEHASGGTVVLGYDCECHSGRV